MTATGGETRTKLHLTEGESTARTWELVSAAVQTTLTVGAGADCNWVVHAEGVRARHLTLQWDGQQLLAADLSGAGDVLLDGEALGTAWRPVPPRAQLRFGRAALTVDTESLPVAAGHPLDGPPISPTSPRGPAQGTDPAASAAPGRPQATPSAMARKATLLGVAPISAESVSAARGASSPAPSGDGFRVLRPSEAGEKGRRISSAPPGQPEAHPGIQPLSAGAPSTTSGPAMVSPPGLALPAPPAPPAGRPSAADGRDARASNPPAVEVMPDAPSPSKVAAMRSGTLIGVAVPEIVHSLRTKRNAGSLADDDQRTLHGYVPPPPASAPTAPLGSDPSVVAKPGTLIQVRDARGGSPAADATQRIGSAWQESPHGSVASFGGQDRGVDQRPSGVLDSAPNGAGAPAAETWPSRDSTGASDDAAPLTSRAPASAGMPLRYLGIALLTVVAYFAWLYLLDHL